MRIAEFLRGGRASNVKHANSFDFARLFGSLLVLYSHAYALTGATEPVIGGFATPGSLGVFIFFSISGYLVTMSWLSDSNVLRFAMRRSLRIFPALAVVILLSTFVLGPIVTTLPLHDYFHHSGTYEYLENIGLYVQYYLPGCFGLNAFPNAVNGSLWSLPPEVLMYVILIGLGWASLVRKRVVMILFTGVVGVAALYLLQSSHPDRILFLGMELHSVMLVAPYFWAGCIFCLYRDRIKPTVNTTILMFMVMALLPQGKLMSIGSWIAIPYIVLAFCTQSHRLFTLPAWIGDLSYGIYIYAFPIQQTVYYYGHSKYSFWEMMAISADLTLVCAYLSWHLVENPSLRLKPTARGPTPMPAPDTCLPPYSRESVHLRR